MNKVEKKQLSPLAETIKEGAFLVDVRTPEEFKTENVEGSVNIPLFSVPLRIDEFKNKGNIVVFCLSGGRSEQAKMFLEQNGIDCVTNGGCWYDVEDACHELEE